MWRRCIISIGEVDVIITYIIPKTFFTTKYSLIIFTSKLYKFYDWFSNYLKFKIIFLMFLVIIQNL